MNNETWLRGQAIVKNLLSCFKFKKKDQLLTFDFKSLKKDRGFIIHLAMIIHCTIVFNETYSICQKHTGVKRVDSNTE